MIWKLKLYANPLDSVFAVREKQKEKLESQSIYIYLVRIFNFTYLHFININSCLSFRLDN